MDWSIWLRIVFQNGMASKNFLSETFICHIIAAVDDFSKAFIPLGGDQLVRVRSSGARDLRAGTASREERLEPLFPEMTEFFHVMQDFLEVMI